MVWTGPAIDAPAGMLAMQSINRIIVKTLFLPIFFASSLASAALVVLALLGGLLVVNTSLAEVPATRPDVRLVAVAANELAEAAGDLRLANVVMLGALFATRAILPITAIENALERYLPERHRHLLDANRTAFRAGYASSQWQPKLVA